MSNDRKAHWENVYSTRRPHEVGWYQAYPEIPLHLIASTGVGRNAAIIDVGGGASNLVDALLENGYSDVTVLDLSSAALEAAKARLGQASSQVKWLADDITCFTPPRQYDVWHDRAVFHFLTEAADRQRYMEAARAALPPGGHLIMATFALDGPSQCSGLDVVRYSPESLRREAGAGFTLAESFGGLHITPSQGKQSYTFCRFIRK
ncbi:MAG: SAM-dependent methyltransferase [Nitrosomonadales bacterium]|nr:MAG: SAM-dependent methyltransferase [Nitrosomonadales bacterium]